jgi:hypothetical protein
MDSQLLKNEKGVKALLGYTAFKKALCIIHFLLLQAC